MDKRFMLSLYGLMTKFKWTPEQVREIEICTLMEIYYGMEEEKKDQKRQQAKNKMRRGRRK